MSIIPIIVAVFFAVGVIYIEVKDDHTSPSPVPTPVVTVTPADTPSPVSVDSTPGAATSPTGIPSPAPTSTTSPSPSPSADNYLSFWIYPGASVDSRSSSSLSLTSSASPDAVTDWYKNKLADLKYQVNTAVKTSTNGNVLNKLVAVSSSDKISIDIEKKSGQEKTTIEITRE